MKAAKTAVAGLAAMAALSGCLGSGLHDSQDTAVNQSAPQTLVVTNTSPDTLTIGAGPATRTLAPGANLIVRFQVTTVSMVPKTASPSGTAAAPTAYTEQFRETDNFGLVDTGSDPLVIAFHKGTVPVTASFSVNLCRRPGWEIGIAVSSNYGLVVPDPVPGIPQPICPK